MVNFFDRTRPEPTLPQLLFFLLAVVLALIFYPYWVTETMLRLLDWFGEKPARFFSDPHWLMLTYLTFCFVGMVWAPFWAGYTKLETKWLPLIPILIMIEGVVGFIAAIYLLRILLGIFL